MYYDLLPSLSLFVCMAQRGSRNNPQAPSCADSSIYVHTCTFSCIIPGLAGVKILHRGYIHNGKKDPSTNSRLVFFSTYRRGLTYCRAPIYRTATRGSSTRTTGGRVRSAPTPHSTSWLSPTTAAVGRRNASLTSCRRRASRTASRSHHRGSPLALFTTVL